MTYSASSEALVNLFWDDFDAVQLLMWYGILTRAQARTERLRKIRELPRDAVELEHDLAVEAINVYSTLMHKCALISEADEYVTFTSEIMMSPWFVVTYGGLDQP